MNNNESTAFSSETNDEKTENISAHASPRRATAEIISVGDELLSGAILDGNAQYLSRSLAEIGVRVVYRSTTGDDLESTAATFAEAFRRADVVVVTGGLGPTQDDLTRQAAALALGVELEFDPESFERTKALFVRRGREMPESNRIQAFFPSGARVVVNPNGTAPGFSVEESRELLPNLFKFPNFSANEANTASGDFLFLAFPGVPAEMKEMWNGPGASEAVAAFADRLSGGRRPIYRSKTIRTFGAGESGLEERLPHLIERGHIPTVGITAQDSIISLRIFAEGATEEECARQIQETSKMIYDAAGEFIFGEGDDTFPTVICRNLRAQCRRVAVFEWGTRGFLATKFDSDVLAFGRVFGESERAAFERLFAPDADESRLADALRAASFEGTIDYVLAVGPYPSDEPVGVAFVDLRDPEKPTTIREEFVFGGHPAVVDALFCNRALDMLRKYQ